MRQIVLDTETTGLETSQDHRIIEIGCVEMVNRKLTGRHYHQYINPERKIDEGAMEVHGITDEYLQDKPLFSAISSEFLDFLDGAELIIHNAPFDLGFINHELKKLGKKTPLLESSCRVIDTLGLARQKHPGQKNSLDAFVVNLFESILLKVMFYIPTQLVLLSLAIFLLDITFSTSSLFILPFVLALRGESDDIGGLNA